LLKKIKSARTNWQLCGEVLPNQNGAPIRLVVPWKYGFKSIKSGAVDSDDSASPGAVVDGIGSRRDFLNKLLDRIPEENRYLLLLRELEGYSVAHLAEATGLNENTIKMKLLWTRQALAKSAKRYRCTS
jgi:hypothetical protein